MHVCKRVHSYLSLTIVWGVICVYVCAPARELMNMCACFGGKRGCCVWRERDLRRENLAIVPIKGECACLNFFFEIKSAFAYKKFAISDGGKCPGN